MKRFVLIITLVIGSCFNASSQVIDSFELSKSNVVIKYANEKYFHLSKANNLLRDNYYISFQLCKKLLRKNDSIVVILDKPYPVNFQIEDYENSLSSSIDYQLRLFIDSMRAYCVRNNKAYEIKCVGYSHKSDLNVLDCRIRELVTLLNISGFGIDDKTLKDVNLLVNSSNKTPLKIKNLYNLLSNLDSFQLHNNIILEEVMIICRSYYEKDLASNNFIFQLSNYNKLKSTHSFLFLETETNKILEQEAEKLVFFTAFWRKCDKRRIAKVIGKELTKKTFQIILNSNTSVVNKDQILETGYVSPISFDSFIIYD